MAGIGLGVLTLRRPQVSGDVTYPEVLLRPL